MKCLSLQIHPERSPELDEQGIICLFREFCSKSVYMSKIDIEEQRSPDRYININCVTDDLRSLWDRIKSLFYEHKDFGPALSKASIVVCEGDNGWDDYLLLHHFDETEEVDQM